LLDFQDNQGRKSDFLYIHAHVTKETTVGSTKLHANSECTSTPTALNERRTGDNFMLSITDHLTSNIILLMLAGTFLIISFKQAAALLFRAIIFVSGLLICAATAVFSVNFMLLGVNAPPQIQWYDIGTLMYYARAIFGGVIIVAQVKSFITWQQDKGGKWFCIGATFVSVCMSVYTFQADIMRSAAAAAQSNVKKSLKYNTLAGELNRLKKQRDGIAAEKKTRLAELKAKGRYVMQQDKERQYFDERISRYNGQIEALANELDQYAEKKKKGGLIVSTKGTFEGIAEDAVFFFNLDSGFWQKRIEMALQYLLIASISLMADCAAMSFIFFGLGFLGEVKKKEAWRSVAWLLQLRPEAKRVAFLAWEKLRRLSTWSWARLLSVRRRYDVPDHPAKVSNDTSIKSDFLTDIGENRGDVSGSVPLPASEIKVNGVTVKGFNDVEKAKRFMTDVYQKMGSYSAVYKELGISSNTSSATMLKAVLDEAGIDHSKRKKRVNSKAHPLKKSLQRLEPTAAKFIQ
jgi:hypothetical protein